MSTPVDPGLGGLADLEQRLGRGGAAVGSCPAPSGGALRLVDATEGPATVFFSAGARSRSGPHGAADATTWVGLGAAYLLRETGESRFERLIAAQERSLRALRAPAELSPWLRFFGGAAFQSHPAHEDEWQDFGDATFVLPRVLYADGPLGARLVAIDAPDLPGGSQETLRLVRWAWQRLHAGTVTGTAERQGAPRLVAETTSCGPLEFESLVAEAQRAIARGEVTKVAVARRVTVTLDEAPRLSEILERMATADPEATRFALRLGQRTFVGATPERLVRRSGALVWTEAVAGTVARGPDDRAAQNALCSSDKELEEHRIVVREIESALAPWCQELQVEATPELRELPHLYHLCTPIRGTLREPRHLLSLAQRLHPTPAVGGFPREAALDFIAQRETTPRGWYAAPFGWVDGLGDGELVVALRSALVEGPRVHLYAGAGIVRGSDPHAEFAETELKLRSIRAALGLAETSRAADPSARPGRIDPPKSALLA